MKMSKPVVLVPSGYYYPGRARGPIRSIIGLVENLGEDFDFKIIAANHNLGDTTPFESTVPDTWQKVGNADVMYVSNPRLMNRTIFNALEKMHYDVLYLNSFFSLRNSILPLLWMRLGRVPRKPVVIAPRGELFPKMLQIRKLKKTLFSHCARLISLHESLTWQGTAEPECQAIDAFRKYWGIKKLSILESQNMRPNLHSHPELRPIKTKSELRLIFLARLVENKQLHVALESLRNVRGNVVFDIYGTLEQKDKEYFYKCRELASTMPAHVSVSFCGEADGWKVGEIFCQYHAFFLPTLSENYGHAIAEALSAGCPVVISDQTPWQNLVEKGIGWDIPVGDVNGYTQAIQTLIDMDPETYERFSSRARQFGDQERLDPQTIDNAKKLFLHAMKN